MLTMTGGTPDHDPLAPLHTDADVLGRVDQLVGEGPRHDRSLRLLFLAADAVQLPVALAIDDVPANPGPGAAESICYVIAHVLNDAAPGGSAVITLVLDSGRNLTDSDKHWLIALRAAAARAGVQVRMFCVSSMAGVRQWNPAGGQPTLARASRPGTSAPSR